MAGIRVRNVFASTAAQGNIAIRSSIVAGIVADKDTRATVAISYSGLVLFGCVTFDVACLIANGDAEILFGVGTSLGTDVDVLDIPVICCALAGVFTNGNDAAAVGCRSDTDGDVIPLAYGRAVPRILRITHVVTASRTAITNGNGAGRHSRARHNATIVKWSLRQRCRNGQCQGCRKTKKEILFFAVCHTDCPFFFASESAC